MRFNGLLFNVINMSITGGVVILAVLVLRMLLRRAPKIISYCLWSVVLFRLLCPVSFSLPFSLLETAGSPAVTEGVVHYIPEDILYSEAQTANMQAPEDGNGAINNALPLTAEKQSADMVEIGMMIWGGGMLLILTYAVGMLIILIEKLRGASLVDREKLRAAGAESLIPDGIAVYEKRGLPTPFVLGVIRPNVYLPSGIDETELRYILLHEGIHIRRGDHIVKVVSFFTLCLHWFNPLVWAAFFLSGRDMEMACDEAVLRRLGNSVKKDYSASLLNLATGRRILGGAPLAFGEGDTGSRIRNVLKYRKPRTILICTASVTALAAAVLLLANPMGTTQADEMDDPMNEKTSGQVPEDQTPYVPAPNDQTENDQADPDAKEDAAKQIAAYRAMERGERFTWETLEKLMEESTPLLESYAGYDRAIWEEPEDHFLNAYLQYFLWTEEPEAAYRLMISYRKEDNVVDMVYLVRVNDQSILDLYYHEKWRDADLKEFVSHIPELSDWVEEYTLPKRDQLSANPFSADVGTLGGQIFTWIGGTESDESKLQSVHSYPSEWGSAVAIYRIESIFSEFSEGKLTGVWLMQNHCALEVLETVEGGEEQALLCLFECDLLTAAEIGEAEANGITLSEEDMTGKFWYVCFGREQSEYGYVMMLNQKYFTKEEAIAAAKSVRFKENAW